MDLIKLESKIPLKAIPEEELNRIIYTDFSFWISKLLSLTGETSADRLRTALPAIKEHFWSLGMKEVKIAFEMYADGKLTTQPIPNYFDRILVGQIFKDYKLNQRQKPTPVMDDKETNDFMYAVQAFDYFVQNGAIPEQCVWLYEYLTDHKRVLSVSKAEKKKCYLLALDKYENNDVAVLKSKIWLLEHYFLTLNAKGKHIKDEI